MVSVINAERYVRSLSIHEIDLVSGGEGWYFDHEINGGTWTYTAPEDHDVFFNMDQDGVYNDVIRAGTTYQHHVAGWYAYPVWANDYHIYY